MFLCPGKHANLSTFILYACYRLNALTLTLLLHSYPSYTLFKDIFVSIQISELKNTLNLVDIFKNLKYNLYNYKEIINLEEA